MPHLVLVRQGARQIIAQAVEAELAEFWGQYQDLKDDQGRAAVVRNGYLPERAITTGVGVVEVQLPKVRDRGKVNFFSPKTASARAHPIKRIICHPSPSSTDQRHARWHEFWICLE